MKLLRCYIENFGNLHEYKHEFKDGLNTIKEDNGFGKTTFATFIKSMFYGLDVSVKAGNSDRKLYKPWQGGAFGGNLEFEIDGKQYRIERFFANKASEDTFMLYDLKTNLESKDFSENIGEEIFKINKEAYERSTYIPQGKTVTEMEDSISAKLGNVLESENDVNTSDEAIKKITETMKYYVKTGGKGALNEKKTKLNELQRNLEKAQFDEENLDAREKRLEEINQEIKQKQNEKEIKQKLLTQRLEQEKNSAKQETYKNILENLDKTQKDYDMLKEFFKNGIPENNELEDVSSKYSELEKLKIEISNNVLFGEEKVVLDKLKDKFYGKNISIEEIDQKILSCTKLQEFDTQIQKAKENLENMSSEILEKEKEKKKTKNKKIVLLVVGVLIIIIGIILMALRIGPIAIGIVTSVFGAILTLMTFGLKENKNTDLDGNMSALQNSLSELESNRNIVDFKVNEFIELFTSAVERNTDNNDKLIILSNLKAEYTQYRQLMEKNESKEKTNNIASLKKTQLENDIKTFMSQYFENINMPFIALMQEINMKKSNLIEIEKDLQDALKIKEEYENANNVMINEISVENVEDIDEKQLQQEINALSIRLDELLDMKNQLKNQIEVLENKIDDNEYLQTDIENLSEEIKENEDKYKVLEKTKKLLETAKESFSSSYLKDMVEGFKYYLNLLDDKDLETDVDINLSVKIDVAGSKRDVKNFSSGYQDLIYICMRLGLIKSLFKNENPFVVLDDPFVNLDDAKTQKAINLLKDFSQEYQVIYFVCNNSRI